MSTAQSPPIVNGAGAYTWRGSASVISYQVRFYKGADGIDERSGGDATREISVEQTWHYEPEDVSRGITSAIENTPAAIVVAGEWQVLGLGLGETMVKFTITTVTPAADSTHYRVLVKS